MRWLLSLAFVLLLSCSHGRSPGKTPCEAYCNQRNRVCAGYEDLGLRDYGYRCVRKDKKEKEDS